MVMENEIRFSTRTGDSTQLFMKGLLLLTFASSLYIFTYGLAQIDMVNKWAVCSIAALIFAVTLLLLSDVITSSYREYVLTPTSIVINTLYSYLSYRNSSVRTSTTDYTKLLCGRGKVSGQHLHGWRIDLFLIGKNGEHYRMRNDLVDRLDNSDIEQTAKRAAALTGLHLEITTQDRT